MEKQCAGCGAVFEDGQEPLGAVTPRPHGCCPDCNAAHFRTHEQNEVKPAEAPRTAGPDNLPVGVGVSHDGKEYRGGTWPQPIPVTMTSGVTMASEPVTITTEGEANAGTQAAEESA